MNFSNDRLLEANFQEKTSTEEYIVVVRGSRAIANVSWLNINFLKDFQDFQLVLISDLASAALSHCHSCKKTLSHRRGGSEIFGNNNGQKGPPSSASHGPTPGKNQFFGANFKN